MKIDVEGHEAAVLRGALATITRDRPVVIFEMHKRNLEILSLFALLSYTVEQITLTHDYLAVPRGV